MFGFWELTIRRDYKTGYGSHSFSPFCIRIINKQAETYPIWFIFL